MLYRYEIDQNTGEQRRIATIYTHKEHKINSHLINREVYSVIRTLKNAGYEAYIVGGAVRDLMIKRTPKDFDIATNAKPIKIKQLFRNARIIGKRFKLCHIYFSKMVIEVATFRTSESDNFVNAYGENIVEDASRRDFSINALYYCPISEKIIDCVGGVKDFRKKRVCSVLDLNETFKQDPVRMIRAIKYSIITDFRLDPSLKNAIVRDYHLISQVPVSRMVEEFYKIIASGHSQKIFEKLKQYKIFPFILPKINSEIVANRKLSKSFNKQLRDLDKKNQSDSGVPKYIQIATVIFPFVIPVLEPINADDNLRYTFLNIKKCLKPLTPPNSDIEKAARKILKQYGIKPSKHAFRGTGRNRWTSTQLKRNQAELAAKEQ